MQDKQQWKKRVDVFRYIYSSLINEHSSKETLSNAFENNLFDKEQMKVIEYFANNKQKMIDTISKYLKTNWTFKRLPFVDQAILFVAISERRALNIDFKIVIDQALVNAKYYSESNSAKYINAILDKILKEKNG